MSSVALLFVFTQLIRLTLHFIDDKAPVTDTNIPSHLEQMLEIRIQEEGERESGETGPCMEYLLHHKILDAVFFQHNLQTPADLYIVWKLNNAWRNRNGYLEKIFLH